MPENRNPEDIPVPSDDELLCEAFSLETEQYWEISFNLTDQEIGQLAGAENQEECITLLVTNAKRQKVEVKMSNLSPADRARFDNAKGKEIDSWLETQTVAKIARHRIPPENILKCRWVLTWKNSETNEHLSNTSSNQNRIPKARLVVLGFMDPKLHEIQRDSPTLTKLGRSLILQLSAANSWRISSFDVKTAFLRGTADQERLLGLEPVPEFQSKLQMRQGEVLQLLKGAYGRADAPLLWFREIRKGLLDLDLKQCPMDPCVFTLTDPEGKTCGAIGLHVDDGIFGGNHLFEAKLIELSKKYPFGSRKHTGFVFTGIHVSQGSDMTISLDQSQYVKEIEPIKLTPARRKQQEDLITEEERQSLRAVIGSLLYAAVNTRPDLCSRLGQLQTRINNGQVTDLLEANRVLHEAKQYADTKIAFQPIPISETRFLSFSDASFASNKNDSSHQGLLIMPCQRQLEDNQQSRVNPIIWASMKIQKVAVSTLSAESMSLAGAIDTLEWVRLFWAWIVDSTCAWRLGDKTLTRLPPAFSLVKDTELHDPNETMCQTKELLDKVQPEKSIMATDCKSLYDLVSRTATPSCSEFRTLLQAKLIKEHIETGICLRWVPSGAQIADSLTKIMDNTILREVLRIGKYKFQDESELLKQRADTRTRLKWLRSNAQIFDDGKAKTSTSK